MCFFETIELADGRRVRASLVDANPAVFVQAREIGFSGSELPKDTVADPRILAIMEEIRVNASVDTTFATLLLNASIERGNTAAVIDADIGQSEIGPPAHERHLPGPVGPVQHEGHRGLPRAPPELTPGVDRAEQAFDLIEEVSQRALW